MIRPVTRTGQAARGYQVVREDDDNFQCLGAPSPVAVDPNIRQCGSSATDTVACWKSAVPSTVLCLRDPLTHTLVHIAYQGGFAPIAAPTHPDPQVLVLDDSIRDGGAWNSVPGYPKWFGWYYCPGGADVYGPVAGHGIYRSASYWSVRTVTFHIRASPTIRTHSVKAAYFVGSA